jgi:hypothetical protein
MIKIKKIGLTGLLAALLAASLVWPTGCRKNKAQTDRTELTPVDFNDNEAFRMGDYQVGIDIFMLYAIDAIPGFVSEFGEDCWTKESIDLTWRKEEPKKAFILYLTDIIASALACDIYYSTTIGELEDSVKEICENIAHERYEELLAAGMPEGVVSEESIFQYSCSTYKLSYVVEELSTTYEEDLELIQAAIMGMRDSIDSTFDYDRNINWTLVESIDYSAASIIDGEHEDE